MAILLGQRRVNLIMQVNKFKKPSFHFHKSFMASLILSAISLSGVSKASEISQNVDLSNPPKIRAFDAATDVGSVHGDDEINTITSLHLTRNDGNWLVNNTEKPAIKTINNRMNYITFFNDSKQVIANFVIPKLDFEVIAKNGVLLSTKCHISADDEHNTTLWIEPRSDLTVAFINDLSTTPLQAIISSSSKGNKLVAIFGPEKPKEFSLQIEVAAQMKINANLFHKTNDIITPNLKKTFDGRTKMLHPNLTYIISKIHEPKEFRFSKPVFIAKRNSKCAGNHYWAKSIVAYPNEEIHVVVNSATEVN